MSYRRQAPTQLDVAQASGVSRATVSAVINGRAQAQRIPEQTERRVREVIQALGYVANPAARTLKQKRNRLLGVHSFQSVFPISSRDFYHEFLMGVEEQAVAEGHDLVLFTSTEEANGKRRLYRDGANRLNVADGSVLLGVTHHLNDLTRLANEGYTFVHIGRKEVPEIEIAWVGADYARGTRGVMLRLAELGHSHICYLAGEFRLEAQLDREQGYREGCAEAGVPGLPVFVKATDLSQEWFDMTVGSGVTAFVTVDEDLADTIGVMAARRGMSIPADLSVVALLGTSGGPAPGVRWSGMGIPRNAMGRASVRLLVELLDDPTAVTQTQILLECTPPEESTMAEVNR